MEIRNTRLTLSSQRLGHFLCSAEKCNTNADKYTFNPDNSIAMFSILVREHDVEEASDAESADSGSTEPMSIIG